MQEESKTKIKLSIISFLVGIYMCLEGSGITNIGTRENNTPAAILVLVGIIFILAGIMIITGNKSKLNNLLASIVTASMGIVGAWVSLYGESSSFSGNGMLLSNITNLPLERIMFGIGSLLCFLVSAYAFGLFLKDKAPIK